MSQETAQTAIFGLGGTSKDIGELYDEIYDLREEEDALYTEIINSRNEAILGIKDEDGNFIKGADGKPITRGDFYGPRGAKLIKKLMEIGARTANRVGKVKKAYYKELADHKANEDEDIKQKFISVKDIKQANKKVKEKKKDNKGEENDKEKKPNANTGCDACDGLETDADVSATMDLVRKMLYMN